MYGSKYFRVVRGTADLRGVGDLTITGTSQPIGEWYDYSDVDSTLGALANGRAAGFLSQGVTTDGMDYEARMLEHLPDYKRAWSKITLEQVPINGELEVECAADKAYDDATDKDTPVLLVTAGTGALTAATAKGTLCSYQNGRIRVAQSGEHSDFEVIDAARTPLVDDDNIRILFRRVDGADIP